MKRIHNLILERENSSLSYTKNGPNINCLPSEILCLIFLKLSANDLCKNVILTCQRWKDIIESEPFWTEKLLHDKKIDIEIIKILSEKDAYNPKRIYFKNPFYNLIKNARGEQCFNHWVVNNPYNFSDINIDTLKSFKNLCCTGMSNQTTHKGIVVEFDNIGSEELLDENKKNMRRFATSYFMCEMYQLIDLHDFDFDKVVLEKLKPQIEVSDSYSARYDCGSEYHIRVVLYDENFSILDRISFDQELPQWTKGDWRHFKHVFKDYPSTLRFILFQHGGKDKQFWSGNYGIKLTNSKVMLRFIQDQKL